MSTPSLLWTYSVTTWLQYIVPGDYEYGRNETPYDLLSW